MSFSEYSRHDGLGLAQLIAKKEISAAEVLEEAIARAERLNPMLNAVVFKEHDRARKAAGGALPQGPFAGVPFLLKDISLQWQGTPTRQGSRFFPPFPSDHDSYLGARFRKAGFVVFGKTNVPEFGLMPTTEGKLYGAAHNPWNLAHSTGGSSGGSAAAVAAGIVPLAHANDGGGSIRIPASCCGLVGLKPSRGRVSVGPDMAETVDGLAIDLCVSRSARDTAAALDVAAGCEPGDPYVAPPAPASYLAAARQKPKRLRIAVAKKKLDGRPLHPDCLAAVEHAAKLCAAQGHSVEEASPEIELSILQPAFTAIWCGNLAAIIDLIARLTGQTPSPDNLEGLTLGLYEAGKAVGCQRISSGQDDDQLRGSRHCEIPSDLRPLADRHVGHAAGQARHARHRRARSGQEPGAAGRLCALHRDPECHRPARDQSASALECRRASHRRAIRREPMATSLPCCNSPPSSKRRSHGSRGMQASVSNDQRRANSRISDRCG